MIPRSHYLALLLAGQPAPVEGRAMSREMAADLKIPVSDMAPRAFILSTDGEASDRNILRQYWDLSRAQTCGVPILLNHSRELHVGQWKELSVRSIGDRKALVGLPYFAPRNDLAQQTRKDVEDDVILATSIRWHPGELVRRSELDKADPLWRAATEDECGDPAEGYIVGSERSPNLAIEGSFVSIPSDPAAVGLRLFDGAQRALDATSRGETPRGGDWSRLLATLAADKKVRGFIDRELARMFSEWSATRGEMPQPTVDTFFRSFGSN